MMRSMFSAVSGLSAHQAKMDVIGNNIANVNTIGFKGGRVTFAEAFNQTLKGASAGQGGRGGTNPMQIGLGINVGAVETNHTRGAVERTEIPTDLMINKEGFFIVSDDVNYANRHYTRAGNFSVDKFGNVLTSEGYSVLGYNIDPDTLGQENPTFENELSGLIIPKGKPFPAKSTGKGYDTTTSSYPVLVSPDDIGVSFDGNLNAGSDIPAEYDGNAIGTPGIGGINDIIKIGNEINKIEPKTAVARDTTFTVFDELGGEHEVRVAFIKAAANQWKVCTIDKDGKISDIHPKPPATSDYLEFDSTTGKPVNGKEIDLIVKAASGNDGDLLPNGAKSFIFRMDLSKITQHDNDSDASATSIVGYKSGSFESFDIGPDGVITVTYSNGEKSPTGRLALAKFKNPAGLVKGQGNMFDVTPNSGMPLIGKPAEAGFSDLSPGSLEMSNVDLSREFTTMITTQRGFQANSKIITTTDEMLQELVNLKR
ncbi:flagellar hook protein FlgE [Clostridiaceae bacterium 35-E11]